MISIDYQFEINILAIMPIMVLIALITIIISTSEKKLGVAHISVKHWYYSSTAVTVLCFKNLSQNAKPPPKKKQC